MYLNMEYFLTSDFSSTKNTLIPSQFRELFRSDFEILWAIRKRCVPVYSSNSFKQEISLFVILKHAQDRWVECP